MRAAAVLLAAACCLARACAQSELDAASSVASTALLRGASALVANVVTPALQFAARGSRGVNERASYNKYIIRGPYAVGWRLLPAVPKSEGDWSWEVVSSLAAGVAFQTTFQAKLYYPAIFAGRNSPIAQRSAAPFPIVGFATGWTCDVAMYVPIIEHLASHGMVVVAPLFNDLANEPLTQVNFRSQLSQILSTVKYVGAQSSSAGVAFGDLTTTTMWHNRVDVTRLGLVGHSAGAGVVIQGAAEQGSRVKAVATLGAWVNVATTPWMASLANTVTAPVMLLSGQNDTMAPLATNAQRVFDSLTSPRVMPIISGGSHWCARLHAAGCHACD
jgi:predicted dienelactone hydrolase